jgi:hypothetical protein
MQRSIYNFGQILSDRIGQREYFWILEGRAQFVLDPFSILAWIFSLIQQDGAP